VTAGCKWIFPITGLLIGLVIGTFGFTLSWLYADGGHGTYLPATIFFPYTMYLAKKIGVITGPLIALASIEFPAYGAIIGFAATRGKWRTASLTLILLHSGVFILTIVNAAPNFSRIEA